jgi:hypothetical protein
MVVCKTENVLDLKLNRRIKVFKKLTVTQLVNELLPVFYETPKFIVVFPSDDTVSSIQLTPP